MRRLHMQIAIVTGTRNQKALKKMGKRYRIKSKPLDVETFNSLLIRQKRNGVSEKNSDMENV